MKHLNILIVYLIYIKFSLYKFQVVSTYYRGPSTCLLYNSINYTCFECSDENVIIDNICYKYDNDKHRVNSIYQKDPYENVFKDIPENKKKTVFDFNGKLLGDIQNASITIDAETEELRTYYIDRLHFFTETNSFTHSSFQFGQETINIIEFSDYKFYYYFHACYQGLFLEYCQFLANICTLSIYNSQCLACKAIELLNNRIKEENVLGEEYKEYDHFLTFNESLDQLKKTRISETQTSLDSSNDDDNNNNLMNKLNLYLAK